MFRRSTDLFDALPFEGLKGSVFQYYRTAVLRPAVRAINEGSSSGMAPYPAAGKHCILDHNIDVDRAIVDRHGPERRNFEEGMGLTGFGQWATTIISGDQSTNPRVFTASRFAPAVIPAPRTFDSSGGALSLLKLDQAIQQVNNPTHCRAICPRRCGFRRRAPRAFGLVCRLGWRRRAENQLQLLFAIRRTINPYMLDFNEVAAGGGRRHGIAVRISVGEGRLRGLQLRPMEVRDIACARRHHSART